MTPAEEKKLLELVKENNEILHKMRRSLFWGRVFKAVYLIIILGVTFGAYYFIQPYLEGVLGTYQSVLGGEGQVPGVGSSLPNIFDIF